MTQNILRIEASATSEGSTTRDLNDRLVGRIADTGAINVVTRDLAKGLPQISETWINANFTDPKARSTTQNNVLALSDILVAELKAAETIIISVPIHNFDIPAALKAWIDQVARADVTFHYTATGPVGLLKGKRVILSVASGTTEIGSEVDFATEHLTYMLGFLGITDVQVITADTPSQDAERALKKACDTVDRLALAA